jgi:amino acid transporter
MGSTTKVALPIIGTVEINSWPIVFMAVAVLAVAVFLLYRRITLIEKLAKFLWVGVAVAIVWVIFAGLTNFDPKLAFDFPEGAFVLDQRFFLGLGSALLIAVYDYWGYYNVNFFAGEVKEPEKTIPRAILLSISLVAVIYIVMNISILGVIPWREFADLSKNDALRQHMISTLMERLYGTTAGTIATVLIMWTAFASVFSLLLGYSRVPYAAAQDGNYFKIFARLHEKNRFPYVSLLVLGSFAALFCLFRLADIIAAMDVIRILVQFLAQIFGLLRLQRMRPDIKLPFKMWFYPLPALVALNGFLYVLFMRPGFQKEVIYAAVLLIIGLAVYLIRSYKRSEYPFGPNVIKNEA